MFIYDGGQPIREQLLDMCIEKGAQHQNVAVDAGLPQGDAFVDGGHRQPCHARLNQRTRDVDGAVTVGIGLDDGHDAAVVADTLSNLREIIDERGKVDGGVGGVSQVYLAAARGMKRLGASGLGG